MAQIIFDTFQNFYVYAAEVPVVLGIVLVFVYVMYSLNLFRKE